MNEIYWGCYLLNDQKLMVLEAKEIVCTPQQLSLPDSGPWYGIGSGWLTYAHELMQQLGQQVQAYHSARYPQASAMIPLARAAFHTGQFVRAGETSPVYLRNRIATVPIIKRADLKIS